MVALALSATAMAAVGTAPTSATDSAASDAAAVPTVTFSGRTWTVKTSSSAVGPGPNVFSEANAVVDSSGYLRLRISKSGRRWTCGEVVLQESLGYGTYEWELGSNVASLDPFAVLGLFTWNNDDASYFHREIDFEAARWGNSRDRTNAQWVVQPWDVTGNLRRFTIGTAVPTVVRITWSASMVDFATLVDGAVVESWSYTGSYVPPAGGENTRMNLWLYKGRAPKAAVEVIIRQFTFTPPA